MDILPKPHAFTLFSETPLVKSQIQDQDTFSTVHYPMALSHDTSFSLTPLEIKAFNPKTQKSYTLRIPTLSFEINSLSLEQLLDKKDSPKTYPSIFQYQKSITQFLKYLIVFVAGVISALLWKKKPQKHQTKSNQIVEKIRQTTQTKALLALLLAQNEPKLDKIIQALEATLYSDTTTSFSTLKKEAQHIMETNNASFSYPTQKRT
jgi:hypothetical protein